MLDLVRDLALLDNVNTLDWGVTFIEEHSADRVLLLDRPEQVE